MSIQAELLAAPKVPLRYLVRFNPRPTGTKSDESCYLPMEAISEFGAVDSSRRRATSELRQGYSFLADGDVAYAKVTPCFENGKGLRATALPGGHAFATTEITVMRPSSLLDSRYLAWTLQSEDFRAPGEAHMSGAGGLRRVPESYAARFRVRHPSIDVQRAIADYLDRETAQIDAFIAKNEELVNLLTERRTTVVTQFVSRGLREGVARKVSGTEWATDIPAHWQVGNIRRFASMRTGHTPSRQHPEYWVDCDIPWFTLADVWQLRQGRRDMGKTTERISRLGLANSAAELLPAGTVALSRTASVGFAGIMRVEMATSQDFWNWIPRGELISEYLWYQFQAMKPVLERLMTGSTHRTIYQNDAASITILVPPVSEQHEIVDRLDTVIKRIDDAIASAHSGVALARERRAALISATVTGRIDVGVAA